MVLITLGQGLQLALLEDNKTYVIEPINNQLEERRLVVKDPEALANSLDYGYKQLRIHERREYE